MMALDPRQTSVMSTQTTPWTVGQLREDLAGLDDQAITVNVAGNMCTGQFSPTQIVAGVEVPGGTITEMNRYIRHPQGTTRRDTSVTIFCEPLRSGGAE
jgi:hypothetical protein